MVASRMSDQDIAAIVGCGDRHVQTLRASPLFRSMVETHKKTIVDVGIKSALDMLTADAPHNVKFLRNVRDGLDIDDDIDRARLRLSAAGMLFERQVPKKSEQEINKHTTFTVEFQRKQLADEACKEVDDPIDTEFEEVLTDDQCEAALREAAPEAARQLALPAPKKQIVIRDCEELTEELRAREYADLE